CPRYYVREGASFGRAGPRSLPFVHQLVAAFVYHSGDVRYPHVLSPNSECQQQVEAGERGRSGTGGDDAHVGDRFADEAEPVHDRGTDDDGGAVLIVVEDRDAHPLTQGSFDFEAFGCLYVFQVDGAEGRLQRCDDVDQPARVFFLYLDVEDVDAGELLEENGLAFHDRLRGERSDGAEAQHRGSVGDDRDQIAARGNGRGVVRVRDDCGAGRGHSRGVGEGEVALRSQRLGRRDRDLARDGVPVIGESGVAQVSGHRTSWALWLGRRSR